MLASILSAIQDWATGVGGVGLFVVAALDSSFLSFPQVNDVLILYLSTRTPALMPYYAGMSTAGSLLGCVALFVVARRGGGAFLRKRFKATLVDRAVGLYQRFGLLAVLVPALLPPPTPFKLFVLLAGAAGLPLWHFVIAITLGRGIRYFGEGWLAVRYGDRAGDLVREYGTEVGIALAAIVLVAGLATYLLRQRSSTHAVP